ncbi:tRNA pseudouridine synthase A [hydrothermal vent metagenome]|uniref:tRNA pseudouridine synthase A n=1 Tax=hydrothermal vent metagenome TaxID=652676 RepID=A0A1W1C157_9ZZZZ
MIIALGVEYKGTNFHGWQIQKEGIRTVQAEVEKALSIIATHPVRVFCAGRTDAGVHAKEQVIHFDTQQVRPDTAWVLGANAYLPNDICFLWAKVVDNDFHARFSALAREYKYCIINNKIRPSIFNDLVLWEPRKLNIEKMQESLQYLLGEHDFSSFRSSLCQAKSPIKTIIKINLDIKNERITLNLKANAFLHHMVRNIVGTMLKIGREEKPIIWMKEVLEAKDRSKAGMTAPPNGLYFIKAFYHKKFKV